MKLYFPNPSVTLPNQDISAQNNLISFRVAISCLPWGGMQPCPLDDGSALRAGTTQGLMELLLLRTSPRR